MRVDATLQQGNRGLRGGSSLAQLLAAACGKRNHLAPPPLSYEKILAWADAHHERTGQWPHVNSGPVVDAPGERWDVIDNTLWQGHRTLPGGSSLRRLLVKKRGLRHPLHLPDLTEEQIVCWAKQHRERTGSWPNSDAGAITEALGETWRSVDYALRQGRRGLPGRSSLAQLLAARRGGGSPEAVSGENGA